MTKKEFEDITGLKVTAEGYSEEIEPIYMNTDIDKNLFCKLWRECPEALKEIERKTVLVRELYEERKRLENFLIDQAEKCGENDLREKAISMLGAKKYLKCKLSKGYDLWDEDKKLLEDILSE